MVYNYITEKYFDWLSGIVWDRQRKFGVNYHRFFVFLFHAPYIPRFETDEARASDGIAMRYRYADANGLLYYDIEKDLNVKGEPCNMLEMMVGFASRIETHILSDNDYGDRTGQWFWEMVMSLGFRTMDDHRFDENKAWEIIDKFNAGDFLPNGSGSLFMTNNPSVDMRKLDVWYQMQNWLHDRRNGG